MGGGKAFFKVGVGAKGYLLPTGKFGISVDIALGRFECNSIEPDNPLFNEMAGIC